jgi:Tol biopolymer transport system component
MGCGRAVGVGLVGAAAALIALVLADARLRAEPASHDEGRIAFTFGESGADRPAQLAVMDADGKNRRALPPFNVNSLTWSPGGRFIAYEWAGDIYKVDVERP